MGDVYCWQLLVEVLARGALMSGSSDLVDAAGCHSPGLNAAEAVAELASKAAVTVRGVFHIERIHGAVAVGVGCYCVSTVSLVSADLALV